MNRVDKLQENAVVERISTLYQNLSELKTLQYFGSSSVKTNRVFSSSAYDFQFTSVTSAYAAYEITFTPSDTTAGNTGAALQLLYKEIVVANQSSLKVERLVPSGGTQKWRFYISGSATYPPTMQYKLYFLTIGTGTFTCVQVAP